MMTAHEMHNQLSEIVQELEKRQQSLLGLLVEYEAQIQDLLHCIEIEKCSAVTLTKISIRIKDLRLKRRDTKNELEQLKCISKMLGSRKQSIKDSKVKDVKNKKYTYRTDVLIDIMDRHKGDVI